MILFIYLQCQYYIYIIVNYMLGFICLLRSFGSKFVFTIVFTKYCYEAFKILWLSFSVTHVYIILVLNHVTFFSYSAPPNSLDFVMPWYIGLSPWKATSSFSWYEKLRSCYHWEVKSSFPGGSSGKEPACQCRSLRDAGSISGLGGSPGRGNGKDSCLDSPVDRGAWQATVHGVGKNETWPLWKLRSCYHWNRKQMCSTQSTPLLKIHGYMNNTCICKNYFFLLCTAIKHISFFSFNTSNSWLE